MKLVGGRLRLSASDVANYVACGHLTRLDLLHARGEVQPPHTFDIGFDDLVTRGETHERAVLARFRADGLRVAEIPEPVPQAEAVQAMLAAIDDGVDVVNQGVLVSNQGADGASLLGRPDFLVRAGLLPAPDGEPRPAGDHYEVLDAKLARSAKARAVAQVAFYSACSRTPRGSGRDGCTWRSATASSRRSGSTTTRPTSDRSG